jgi:hypothetical protein
MLRVGFLPSDFNPMVLMLGEVEDLRRLATSLRRFAADPSETAVEQSCVSLTASAGPLGIHSAAEPGAFHWRLDAAHAERFADQIETLAEPSRLAGSEILECAIGEDVPVKVSRGEYTDDFLR